MNLARTGPGMTLPLFYEPANVNHCESPPWVISGNRWLARVRPLFPPKQTRGVDRRTAAECQKRTSRRNQISGIDSSVRRAA
jgi:hypothetical protein